MKSFLYLLANVLILPVVIILGDYSNFSIFIFWSLSLILSIYFLKDSFKKCGFLFLLSPCIITYLYSIFNYWTGALYYSSSVLENTELFYRYSRIDNFNLLFSVWYLNLCNTILVLISKKLTIPLDKNVVYKNKGNGQILIYIIIFLVFFIALHFLTIDLSFLGASSFSTDQGGAETGLNYPFIVGIIVLIAYYLTTNNLKWRIKLPIYFFLIVAMAIDSIGSKRELFFAILAIIYVELIFGDKKIILSLRNVVISISIFAVAALYILSASIVRGYGGFEVDTLKDAIVLVPEYVGSEYFNEVVGNNIETPYHYATSVLSIDYTINGKIPILYGETFLKVFFIPIPRSVFGYKPRNMIDVFTTVYDKGFRDMGGSYPVSVYSELFSNFSVLSVFVLLAMFVVFQRFYIVAINNIRKYKVIWLGAIPFSAFFLHFIRGAGLESLIIYAMLSFSVLYINYVFVGSLQNKGYKINRHYKFKRILNT